MDRIIFCIFLEKDLDIYVKLLQLYFPPPVEEQSATATTAESPVKQPVTTAESPVKQPVTTAEAESPVKKQRVTTTDSPVKQQPVTTTDSPVKEPAPGGPVSTNPDTPN